MSFSPHSKNDATERLALEKLSMDDLREFAKIWKMFDSKAHISLKSTVEEALQLAVTLANPEYGLQAFVTGHGRLIGPALSILESVHQSSYLVESTEDHA
ncbi:hypothetical protein G7Y89_g1056 [Cudoniella acicularis]|uniref:Uncharacterized protein n=1 Tax=Cudoniella acicularis TaxID=354080 RepID=A0A8H4W7B5_9HELO|nr:hypothetical protein G7Y89_g1056 [Cudoniella acicularis]